MGVHFRIIIAGHHGIALGVIGMKVRVDDTLDRLCCQILRADGSFL